jgi:hypothetical protein
LAEQSALSKDIVRSPIIAAALMLTLAGAVRAEPAGVPEQHGDIDVAVTVDSTAQSGRASAAVRIHADRGIVWSLLTNCASALRLVPGLVECVVVETAPDGSWQLIRHVIDYSWYVPRLTFVFRADYRYPERISIRQVSGALRVLEGSWDLETDGDFTLARCSLALAPGFWVPRWLIKAALRRDLPKVLRALRSAAESQRDGK